MIKLRFAVSALLIIVFSAVFIPMGYCAPAEVGTFQVVSGSGDNAYLVNTKTGAVWILTHQTLPTGREPVAIPYKFLMRNPTARRIPV